MRRIIIIILVFSAVFGVWYAYNNRENVLSWTRAKMANEKKWAKVVINGITVNAELAETPGVRAQGLSGRKNLKEDEGMLFVFETPEIYTFWMKGMEFSIDMIWIADDTVVDIIEQVPVPGQDVSLSDLPRYMPDAPANFILEVRSGFAQENDIEVGDRVEITR